MTSDRETGRPETDARCAIETLSPPTTPRPGSALGSAMQALRPDNSHSQMIRGFTIMLANSLSGKKAIPAVSRGTMSRSTRRVKPGQWSDDLDPPNRAQQRSALAHLVTSPDVVYE